MNNVKYGIYYDTSDIRSLVRILDWRGKNYYAIQIMSADLPYQWVPWGYVEQKWVHMLEWDQFREDDKVRIIEANLYGE